MLHGIEAPTDFVYHPSALKRDADGMMAKITPAPVTVCHITDREGRLYPSRFATRLPYISGAEFTMDESNLELNQIDLGSPLLFGKGLGTRLLEAGVVHARQAYPNINYFRSEGIRLAVANTAIKVFGKDNVTLTHDYEEYGKDSGRPLEDIFIDNPPQAGRPYLIDGVSAVIHPSDPIPSLKMEFHVDEKEVTPEVLYHELRRS